MEMLKIIMMGSVTIFSGVFIGVVISERSLNIGDYTRQAVVLATLLIIVFVFNNIDNKVMNYVTSNVETMRIKIVQAIVLEIKVITFLYMFFYMSSTVQKNYKLIRRRMSDAR